MTDDQEIDFAAAPAEGLQPVAPYAHNAFLCYAWGESDFPVARIVASRAEVRQFLIDAWFGEEHPDLDEAMARFDADTDDGDAWDGTDTIDWEFEIGGVKITKVYGFTPQAEAAGVPLLNTLRVALDRADFNYRATGIKDFEVEAAKEWVRFALTAARDSQAQSAQVPPAEALTEAVEHGEYRYAEMLTCLEMALAAWEGTGPAIDLDYLRAVIAGAATSQYCPLCHRTPLKPFEAEPPAPWPVPPSEYERGFADGQKVLRPILTPAGWDLHALTVANELMEFLHPKFGADVFEYGEWVKVNSRIHVSIIDAMKLATSQTPVASVAQALLTALYNHCGPRPYWQAEMEALRVALSATPQPATPQPAAAPVDALPEDVIAFLCSVADNLGDMPVSYSYADRMDRQARELLAKYDDRFAALSLPQAAAQAAEPTRKSDADYWLANRTAIIDAIGRAGYTLMSDREGFWLSKRAAPKPENHPHG